MTDQLNKYAAEVECAIGLNVGGGAEGVSAARDAVLAVQDRTLEQLRADLDRIQRAACRTAESLRVAEDQRDRIRTQLLKVFTRTEQAEAAIERVREVLADSNRIGYSRPHLERELRTAVDQSQQPTTA